MRVLTQSWRVSVSALLFVFISTSSDAFAQTPPLNDNFNDAQTIVGATGDIDGTNLAATKESGEPLHTGDAGGTSVWFRWQAPATGHVSFNTAGSKFDTMLAVYTGTSITALTGVAANDDVSVSEFHSSLAFDALEGVVYYIALDGFNGSYNLDIDAYTLQWQQGITPSPTPTPCTRNGKIVFVRDMGYDGNSDVFVMNADGSQQTNVTNSTAAYDYHPAWSPTGAKIAFASMSFAGANLYVMNADGSEVVSLVTVPSGQGNVRAPAWSPDGTKIAFVRDRYDGNADIYSINLADGVQTKLTNNTGDDNAPVWSPDGAKIAYESRSADTLTDIFVMDADGSNHINLSDHYTTDITPQWVPGQSVVSFVSYRDDYNAVYVVSANGGNLTRVTPLNGNTYDYGWSPDGTKIAFNNDRDNSYDIYVMNTNGTNETRLTNYSPDGYEIAWAPDGATISFQGWLKNLEIYAISPDGSCPANLTRVATSDSNHRWQPLWQQQHSNVAPGGPPQPPTPSGERRR